MFRFLFVALLLTSCVKEKELSNMECENLAMESFRMMPHSGKKFNKHCSDRDLKYTRKVCQEAFNDLLLGSPISDLKLKFGKKITGCFNEEELKKYAK